MAKELTLENPEELRAWLQGKPRPWAQAIAVRAALRVLPTIGRIPASKFLTNKRQERLIVAMARANFVSTAALLQPNRDIITAAANAANAANAAGAATNDAYAYAAAAAANAANAYAANANAANANANAANAANAVAGAANAVWRSVSSDTNWLEATDATPMAHRAVALLRQPLWPSNAPKSLADAWNHFVHSPFAAEHGFQPWIQWYEALAALDGKSPPRFLFSDALTLRIATRPDGWWKRPAKAINFDVAAWLRADPTPIPTPTADDAPPEDLIQALDALPGQQPAPYQFDWRDGHMEVLPPDALPNGGISAQRYLDETRDKADSLLDTLARSNCDPSIARKVERLRSVLTDQAADLIPEIVNSRTIAVERLAKWLDNPRDREELSSLLLSDVDDLAETARLLCDNLPELSKENVRKLADALTENNAVDFLTNLNALRDGIKDAKFIGPGAQAAFDTLHEECAEPADDDLQRHKIALYGVTVRNFLNALLRVQKWTSSATAKTADATQSFAKELIKFTQEVRGNIRPEAAKLVAKWIVVTTVSTTAVAALYVTNYGTIREIVRYFSELERVTDSLDMIRSGTVPPPSAPPPPPTPPRTARPTSEKGPTQPT